MSFNKWPKRSAEKNYFMVSNEIFSIGLDFREISLYSYLLRCENRKTYQCYPSYKTIGHAIGMSENTVAKYVRQLEEKGLIYTEPTIMQSKDGKPLNGNLLYTIRPIPGVSTDGVSFPQSPVLQGFSRMSYSKKEELNE